MRWKKVVIGAVLGGVWGFVGLFALDFFCWSYITEIPKHHPPGSEFFFSGRLDRFLEQHNIQAQHMPQAEGFWWRGMLLYWLQQNGETVDRITLVGAFLGASAALVLGQKGRVTSGKTTTKQTSGGANPVAEPRNEAAIFESAQETAQIEMTENPVSLKAAAMKQRTQA